MKTKLPIKRLAQANWMMVGTTTCFLAIFLVTYSPLNAEVTYTIANAGVNMLAVSFIHVGLLFMLAKRYGSFSHKQQRIYRFFVGYVLAVALSAFFRFIRSLVADETWRQPTIQQEVTTLLVGSIGLNMFIMITHNLVLAYQERNDAELENAELKAANAEANNLLLKQQIHPHFLFNALNVLKSLYKKDVQSGDTYIVHLANFLRASISNTSEKVVKLSDEIKICNDYIAMQKIRFADALQYEIDDRLTEDATAFVPSFSLQPLLENVIKHNDATNHEPLCIKMFRRDGYVVVQNNLQPKKHPVASTGYGLTNLMKRYELLTGDEIIINQSECSFSVSIKILTA